MKRDGDKQWIQKANQEINRIIKGMVFNHQSAFIRTTVMQRYRYDTRYRICADYDFFLRCYLDGIRFMYINETISCFLVGGISYQRPFDLVEEAYKIQIDNHVLKKTYGQLRIIRTRVRKYIRKLVPNSIIIMIRNMKRCLMENKSRDNG